jgi:ribonuclease-3
MDLGSALLLGDGELRSGGAERPSILADALEAVFGAVFLDGGFDAARGVIDTAFADVLAGADPATLGKDPKTRLQEWLQARRMPVPEYAVVGTSGEAHAQQFAVECRIPALGLTGSGAGTSRRTAEQAAAAAAYTEAVARERGGQ